MLSAKEIIDRKEKPPPVLPAFGTKGFEPNGSLEQNLQIQHSVSSIKNIISHERVKLLNVLSQAMWKPELHLAEVTHQTGSHWAYMGHKINEKLYIYPEEALYLLETGCIQIIFNGVSLSIQRAYFLLLGTENNITLEKYRVYSLLNSYGYKVLRHMPQNSVTNYEKKLDVHKLGIKLKNYSKNQMQTKRQQDSSDGSLKSNKKLKVKINTALFGHTKDFCTENLKKNQEIHSSHKTGISLDFDYDIYSGSYDKLPFRKSCLQLPNFRVVIHRGENPPPDLRELCKIAEKYKDEIPVIHAIVFFDSIAFSKVNPVILPDISNEVI